MPDDGYDSISVRTARKTKDKADQLADVMTQVLGHRVARPDAVHEAVEAALKKYQRIQKKARAAK
jgi:hypothetical protein